MIETQVKFNCPRKSRWVGGLVLPPHHYKGLYDIYEGGVTWGQNVAVAPRGRQAPRT